MKPVRGVEGRAIPFGQKNVDTDVIIPAKWLKTISREGLGAGAFEAIRAQEGNVFDDPEYAGANILIAGDNFGCGSSREHAVWALAEFGIRAIIAESFAPIFRGNCIRNFVLPITLDRAAVESLAGREVAIDLAMEEVRCETQSFRFEIDPEAKQMLAEGHDAIDLTLAQLGAIESWTSDDRSARPWVYLEPTE